MRSYTIQRDLRQFHAAYLAGERLDFHLRLVARPLCVASSQRQHVVLIALPVAVHYALLVYPFQL